MSDTGSGSGSGNDPLEDDYLTAAQVSRILKVSKMTVYRVISRGELAAVKVGETYRVRRSVLRAYVERGVT